MAKEPSLVVKRRDYSDIAQLQDPLVLEEFFEQPLTYIAETITGALGDGVKSTGDWSHRARIRRQKVRVPNMWSTI